MIPPLPAAPLVLGALRSYQSIGVCSDPASAKVVLGRGHPTSAKVVLGALRISKVLAFTVFLPLPR